VNFGQQEIADASALKRFKAGQLGMLLGFRSLTPELRAAKNLHFDVMPMPKVGSEATIGESSGVCLSAGSGQVDQSADFLAYLVSDEAMSLLTATGFVVPSNNDVAHSDTFVEPTEQPAHATVFTDQVRSIKAMPSDAVWPEVLALTTPLLSKLLYDPLIQSLEDRLKEIDDASELLFKTAQDSPTPAS